MARITYGGRVLESRPGETVLDTLLRAGENPPFSCRHGSCHVCLQRAVSGQPDPASQRGLRPTLMRGGYFLPCRCHPTEDLALAPPRLADLFSPAVVQEKRQVGPDVWRLSLETATSLYYHAGQFVNLRRSDGLTRSYSLASLPSEDYYLEVHVKRLEGGAMSTWLCDGLQPGDELELQGPLGSCFYVPGSQERSLLLVGTGTGVAPLIGIVRDALHSGHRAPIWLFHGSRRSDGLYLHEVLTRLAAEHPQLRYVPCVSGPTVPPGFVRGRAHQVAFSRLADCAGWHVFAAGNPEMVAEVETLALRAGGRREDVRTDAFDVRQPPSSLSAERSTPTTADRPRVSPRGGPDRELWAALGEGVLLNEILTDFYTRVFEDPVLAPYFRGVTKGRLIGQVFSFMRDALKGERSYFGMKPRSAHHWMVISDEIFDHREALMEKTLRRHGLPGPMIERWRAFEEAFRADIVKDRPWKLVIDGVEIPLEGFGVETLSCGAICDGCQRAIDVGEQVRYHLRLGLTYCPGCRADDVAGEVRS